MDKQKDRVLKPGRRYLVKSVLSGSVAEVLVLEVSPQGRVKVRDLLTGNAMWWNHSDLEDVLILEELPGGDHPASGDMHRRIVRE